MQPTVQEGLFIPLSAFSLALMRGNRDKAVFAWQKNRDTHTAWRRREGVLFQDSQELAVKGCENNTEAQAVRKIVNRGINGTVKRALKPTPTPKPLHKGLSECVCESESEGEMVVDHLLFLHDDFNEKKNTVCYVFEEMTDKKSDSASN